MTQKLVTARFGTPIGEMLAVSDEKDLYLLEFIDRKHLTEEIEWLKGKRGMDLVVGKSAPLDSIQEELNRYFAGDSKEFKTAIKLVGSSFQRVVWEELRKIPFGKTLSYSAFAIQMGKPSAYRAVANAIASNPLAIIIPCHRIIPASGGIGGYAGGSLKKQWLLNHETLYDRGKYEAVQPFNQKIPK